MWLCTWLDGFPLKISLQWKHTAGAKVIVQVSHTYALEHMNGIYHIAWTWPCILGTLLSSPWSHPRLRAATNYRLRTKLWKSVNTCYSRMYVWSIIGTIGRWIVNHMQDPQQEASTSVHECIMAAEDNMAPSVINRHKNQARATFGSGVTV